MTMVSSTSVIVVGTVTVFFWGIACCLEWETGPETVVHTCTGKDVTFSWGFRTGDKEDVVDIHWVYQGTFTAEILLATFTHDVFLPNPEYLPRLRHLSNGGLTLRNVTAADSGNYTMEVNLQDKAGSYSSYRQSAYLQVGNSLMLHKKVLNVEQDPQALLDNATGSWVIRLTCGQFTFLGQPPIHVIWTTAAGETKSSTGYENGNFYLTPSSPVVGGKYTCHLPAHFLSDVCATDTQGGDDTVKGSVTVDEFKARMSLIEAELWTVKRENRELKEEMEMVRERHGDEMTNLTQYVDGQTAQLTQYVDGQTAQLTQKIEHVEDSHRSDMLNVSGLITRQKTELLELSHYITGLCGSLNHTVVDNFRRDVSYKGNSKIRDNSLIPGWYRFLVNGTNAIIPTSCPPNDHCGGDVQVWLDLKGQVMPGTGQEIQAQARGQDSSDCTKYTESLITVRNCNTFFVYYLQPISRTSYVASYCATTNYA